VIFIGKPADARHPANQGQPGGSGGRFASDPLASAAQSKDVKFSAGSAVDYFYCNAVGTATLHAALGTIKSNKIVSAEYPAGSGEHPLIRTATDEGFAVRCVSRDDWKTLCGGVEQDAAIPDFGTADAAADAGADGDVGPDMAPLPPRWSLAFDGPMANQLTIGIRDSFREGQSDHIDLKFRVTEGGDTPSQRIPVTFSLGEQRPPNTDIDPPEGRQELTDPDGYVTVQVRAGGTPGVVSVQAKATLPDNTTLTVTSPPVTIRGGIPSKRGFGFQCKDPVVAAFGVRSGNSNDEWHLGLDDGTDCYAHLADRLSGVVDQATNVFFLSEAGNVIQAGATDAMGVATTHLRVGPPVPVNTAPMQYEQDAHLVDGDFNPRDGLVRLIAVTRGEEEFTDVDGNQFYEEGVDMFDSSQDLPEPYVDSNDNGQWDVGEVFRDLNGNGSWDDANQTWDRNTEIWEDTEMLWVGDLSVGTGGELSYFKIDGCDGDQGCSRDPIANCPDGLDFYLNDRGAATVAMRFTDSNGNCLDGYNSGTVNLATNGSLAVFPQAQQNFTINECFRPGCGGEGCPEPVVYTATILDPNALPPLAPGQMPPAPTIVDVAATITYRGVGNSQNRVTFTLRGCVQ
jgi:hypothetical protein